jgi:nucleoside-diphosphate-sugar epimerase
VVQISSAPRRILVTGASGFVGQALTAALDSAGYQWIAATRNPQLPADSQHVVVGDIGPDTDWRAALHGIDCVVHLAARTHVLDDRSNDPYAAYRHINVFGTRALAQQAAATGVRRLIFLSSIKVNGETTVNHPYTENDTPQPEDAYGVSKFEAEEALKRIGTDTGLETVVLRPPLVYGPGVKGNFLRLLRLIERGIPLPLASINNRRSLVGVANLADAIIACIAPPVAAGKTYLVSDGEDISTPQLISRLASAMGMAPHLLPCPSVLLNSGAALLGKRAVAARLTGSLQVDSGRIRRELGWQPRYSLDQGLKSTAQWYHHGQN